MHVQLTAEHVWLFVFYCNFRVKSVDAAVSIVVSVLMSIILVNIFVHFFKFRGLDNFAGNYFWLVDFKVSEFRSWHVLRVEFWFRLRFLIMFCFRKLLFLEIRRYFNWLWVLIMFKVYTDSRFYDNDNYILFCFLYFRKLSFLEIMRLGIKFIGMWFLTCRFQGQWV